MEKEHYIMWITQFNKLQTNILLGKYNYSTII